MTYFVIKKKEEGKATKPAKTSQPTLPPLPSLNSFSEKKRRGW